MSLLATRIDLSAIAHNTSTMKALVGGARLVAVVKANAYNHGVERVVPVMEGAGADAFGVATFAEAARVRALTRVPVVAWLWVPGEPVPAGIEVAAPSVEHLRSLIDARVTAPVHIEVDTGMNRAGVDEEDWEEAFALAARAGLNVVGLMSHLACADEPANPYNDVQARAFAARSTGRGRTVSTWSATTWRTPRRR